jgi:hypothetical protein
MDRSPTRSPRVPPAITLALAGAASALAACQADPPAPAPVPSAAPAVPSAARPLASAPASVSATPAVPSNSPFSIVARSPDAFDLYPLKGALLVDAAGFLAVLDDGSLRQLPAAMKGLEKGESGRILGLYPDGAWLVAGGGAGTYRWSGDRWTETKLLGDHETVLDLTAWGDKSALAAVAAPGNDMRFVLAAGKPGTEVPVPAPAPPGAAAGAEGEGEPCKVRMKPKPGHVMLAGLPGGELYAAGYACEPGAHGGAIVERWDPKKAQGTVEALPRPESGHDPELGGVLARAPDDVIVYGTEGVPAAPYLARFDGKAWALLAPSPFGGGIDTLAAADDGTLWAAAGGEAWKKAPSGAWEKVPLPGALTVQAVWPRTSADVWAAGRESGGQARALILRTGGAGGADPKEAIRLPPRNAMAGTIATSKRFFATAACERVFVSLYDIGPSKDPVTGKPADVPKDLAGPLKPVLTGELAGLAPIADDDGTTVHVGVVAPSREIGRRLVAAYQEKNPRSAPGLFCHEPGAGAGKQATKIP